MDATITAAVDNPVWDRWVDDVSTPNRHVVLTSTGAEKARRIGRQRDMHPRSTILSVIGVLGYYLARGDERDQREALALPGVVFGDQAVDGFLRPRRADNHGVLDADGIQRAELKLGPVSDEARPQAPHQ